ncbi:MAG TPA: GIY-YIG nuclease family protein [Gemmatimonadaceae bacterium]|jgi:hypothetical protein
MIRGVGLFWERENVWWGAGIKAGALLGVPERNRTREPIDFRKQIGLYALYSDFDLLYVGQAGSGKQTMFSRLKGHGKGLFAGRWNRFSWFGMLWVKKNGLLSSPSEAFHTTRSDALNVLEALIIETAEPALNSQSGRLGKAVTFYRQVRDDRCGPTRDQMIRQVYEQSIKD